MMIHDITQKVGRKKRRVRIGRGEASGAGKTSGRGHKGAASRSGWSLRPAYQGGQINFIQKMPKRGFSNQNFQTVYAVVNVKSIDAVAGAGDEVNVESLAAAGLIRDSKLPLKILGEGEITKKVTVTAHRFSVSAREKIENAGGTVVEIPATKWTRKGVVEAKPKMPLRTRRKTGAAPDPKTAWAERAAKAEASKGKGKAKPDAADKPAGEGEPAAAKE
jgi:large subunit ribosomal protein L15